MPDFDVQLLGKIVTALGFCSEAQFNELSAEPGLDFEIKQRLLDRGYLTREQMVTVQNIMSRDQASSPDLDHQEQSEFEQLVALKRHARSGDLHKALELYEKLRAVGAYAYLGEMLILKSEMSASQISKILKERQQMALFCDDCCSRYFIHYYDPAKEYPCESCGRALHEPQPTGIVEDPYVS